MKTIEPQANAQTKTGALATELLRNLKSSGGTQLMFINGEWVAASDGGTRELANPSNGEIIGRVADWAGGKDQAMAWYRAEPIPAFGGRTAESLVKEGKAAAVRDYLDHVAVGGFA